MYLVCIDNSLAMVYFNDVVYPYLIGLGFLLCLQASTKGTISNMFP